MNSNRALSRHLPSQFPLKQGLRRLITHGLQLVIGLAMGIYGAVANAQNLVVNGDFEAGGLAPWQGGELWPSPSGGVLARVGGLQGTTLRQAVTTVPGKRYTLSVEMRRDVQFGVEVLINAQTQGGALDLAETVGVVGTAPQRFDVSFTATQASTWIQFEVTTASDIVFIDNVSLSMFAPSAVEGAYVGTIATTVNVTDPVLTAKSTRKVTGEINSDGELIVLDGTNGIVTGTIQNSGEFAFTLPDDQRVTGSAVIRGRRIVLEYTIGSYPARTAAGASVGNTIKETLSLIRR